MLEAVKGYDSRAAAGILSGLALRLEQPIVTRKPFQARSEVEERVLAELRQLLKIDPNDHSVETVDRLTDALGEEAARIADVEPNDAVTEKLSREGLLPSDVLQVQFDQQLQQRHQDHWQIEQSLIEATVKQPHREESFASENNVSGVSFFARFFEHKFPARSFWLLVTGLRAGVVFRVDQAFHVYPQDVNLASCVTLTDVLEAFVDRFGVDIELNGRQGKFFKSLGDLRKQDKISWPSATVKGWMVVSIRYQLLDAKTGKAFHLIFAINLTQYFLAVEGKRGWEREILKYLKGFSG